VDLTVTTGNVPPLFPMPRDYPLDPPPALARMQAESPVGRVRLFRGDEAWVVTSYAECYRLLRLPSLSVDFRTPGYPVVHQTHAKFAPEILSHIDPPEHNKYRRMLAAEFTVKRVERLRPQVTAVVEEQFDRMIAAGPGVDMMEALALPAPALMICTMLGVPYEQRDYFVGLADTFLGGHAPVEEAVRANQELRNLIRDLIRAKRDGSDDDLLTRVTRDYVATGELEEEQFVALVEGVLIAGFHTTSSMIGLGAIALLENPDQFAELREDLSLVPAAVEELLRYLSITQMGRHRATTEEIEVGGQVIGPGEGIILASDIANRDPAAFADPNRLILRNGDKRPHQAFGVGIHQCVGAALARLELGIVYTTLAERLPTLKMTVPIEELEFTHNSTVNGVRALPIAW
jgi:cytochrome P450